MSLALHSLVTPQAGSSGWASRLGAAAASLLVEWRVHRELKQLEELDARTLRDIGIAPGGLESAVRYGRRSRPDLRIVRTRSVPAMPASFTEWR